MYAVAPPPMPVDAVRSIGHTLHVLAGKSDVSNPSEDTRALIGLIQQVKKFVADTNALQSDFLGVKKMGRGVAKVGSSITSRVSLDSLKYIVDLAIRLFFARRQRAPLVEVKLDLSGRTAEKPDRKKREEEEEEAEKKKAAEEESPSLVWTAAFVAGGMLATGASLVAAEEGAELRNEVEEALTTRLNRMGDGVFSTGITARSALSCLAEMLGGSAAAISNYCKEVSEIAIAKELSQDLRELGEKIDVTQRALINIAEKRRQAGLSGAAMGISVIAYALLPRKLKAIAGAAIALSGVVTVWKGELIAFGKTRDQRVLEDFEEFSTGLEEKYPRKKGEITAIIQKLSAEKWRLEEEAAARPSIPPAPPTHFSAGPPQPPTQIPVHVDREASQPPLALKERRVAVV